MFWDQFTVKNIFDQFLQLVTLKFFHPTEKKLFLNFDRNFFSNFLELSVSCPKVAQADLSCSPFVPIIVRLPKKKKSKKNAVFFPSNAEKKNSDGKKNSHKIISKRHSSGSLSTQNESASLVFTKFVLGYSKTASRSYNHDFEEGMVNS